METNPSPSSSGAQLDYRMVEVANLVELVQAPAINHDFESLSPLFPVDDLVRRLFGAGGHLGMMTSPALALAHPLLACICPLLLDFPAPPVELGVDLQCDAA